MQNSFTPSQLVHTEPALKAHGVYRIRVVGAELFYIGSTADRGGFYIRFRAHLKDLRRKRHCNERMQSVFDQHGAGAFVFDILQVMERNHVRTGEQAELEKHVGDRNLMNVHTSVQGNWTYVMKASTKQKLSDINAKPFKLEHDGVVHEGMNLTAFARNKGLHQGALTQVLLGNKPQYKGWTLPGKAVPLVSVVDPADKVHTFKKNELRRFAQEHKLNASCLLGLINGRRGSYQGWFFGSEIPSSKLRRTLARPRSTPALIQKRAALVVVRRAKPFVVYKDGVKYEGTNRAAFCREQGMTTSALWLILSGARKHFKGFTATKGIPLCPPA